MLVKILFLFVCLLLLNGCFTFQATKENKDTTSAVHGEIKVKKQAVVFAPTFKSAEADKYYDAVEIYDSSPKASQGLYRYDGLVFVIICIDTNKENITYLEGTAMLRTVAMLKKHYPGLPTHFQIRNKLVEKLHDDETDTYRYATAYREKDIKRKIGK